MELDNNLFTYGHLVKYKSYLEGEIVDENNRKIVEGGLPDGVTAKSDFFLDYKSGIIAFRPITNRLSETQFREMFSKLFEAGHDYFFVSAEIRLIEEEYGIIEAIRRLDKIDKITIDLHPTNPSNREKYRELDERLKKLQASKMKEVIESNEKGLNKECLLDDEIYQGIIMTTDGYGKSKIQGVENGANITISTGQSPIKKEILDSDEPQEKLHQLLLSFQKIWKRKNQ